MGAHLYQRVGGMKENPGVWSVNGAIEIREQCQHCGQVRVHRGAPAITRTYHRPGAGAGAWPGPEVRPTACVPPDWR